jgi:Tfp pilus assembly protein PilO
MGSSTRPIVAIVVVAALAIAFWVLALGPKREQADELEQQVTELSTAVETARSEVIAATQAKRAFPADYRQLVTLGQAAPSGDETASLLVELEQIAAASKVKFNSIQLEGSGEESTAAATSSGSLTGAPGTTAPPTEVAASLLPLGASIGPAGLAVMPYSLDFSGGFFQVADFIDRIDSLVKPNGSGVAVDGRLVTVDGFSLGADTKAGFPHLSATFSVTTYLTPPELGITAGATPSAPAPPTATPAATETPTATAEPASETVSAR